VRLPPIPIQWRTTAPEPTAGSSGIPDFPERVLAAVKCWWCLVPRESVEANLLL
jgi:hypothetical protein